MATLDDPAFPMALFIFPVRHVQRTAADAAASTRPDELRGTRRVGIRGFKIRLHGSAHFGDFLL